MGGITLGIAIILGRWWLHKGAKTSEFVITQKGTVIGYDQYNVGVRQVELLEDIKKKL